MLESAQLGNASASLVPGEFLVQPNATDATQDYMQWKVRITVPLNLTDTTCASVFGRLGEHALMQGRQDSTFDLLYSFKRATPLDQVTYKPLELAEKDPIRHKYGWFDLVTDNNANLLSIGVYDEMSHDSGFTRVDLPRKE